MKSPRPSSKAEAVLRALRRSAGLTVYTAFLMGEASLHSTLHRLRRAGHVIDGVWMHGRSRYGHQTRFKRYRIRLHHQK